MSKKLSAFSINQFSLLLLFSLLLFPCYLQALNISETRLFGRDFSSTLNDPTNLGVLDVYRNTISSNFSFGIGGADQADVFSFTIPVGATVDSIIFSAIKI